MDLVNGVTCLHGLAYHEDTLVCRLTQGLVHIFDYKLLVLNETVHSLTDHPEAFLDCLFEAASDCHHFTHRFHG